MGVYTLLSVVTVTQVTLFFLPLTRFSPVSNFCVTETGHPSSVLGLGELEVGFSPSAA